MARGTAPRAEEGAALLIILMIGFAVASIMLAVAAQAWTTIWRRDSEEELIFRGNQYVDAILLYRKEHSGQFPTNLEDLFKEGPRRLRYIRKLFRDPVNPGGRWGLLYLMPGGQGIYDPMAAQKQGTGGDATGAAAPAGGALPPGVTAITRDPSGTGVPTAGGTIPGTPPPGPLPTLSQPSSTEGAAFGDDKRISEPPLGWPIVGVISRAKGKIADRTFKIYKSHDKVNEWQFHVFDRGVTIPQTPQQAVGGGSPPPFLGPGIGGSGSYIGGGAGPNPWKRGGGFLGGGRAGGPSMVIPGQQQPPKKPAGGVPPEEP